MYYNSNSNTNTEKYIILIQSPILPRIESHGSRKLNILFTNILLMPYFDILNMVYVWLLWISHFLVVPHA